VTPRVVLDTNVIVSGLGWRGAPAAILDAVGDGRLALVTSAPLLAELRRVLEYPKLAKVIQGGAQLTDLVAASGIVVVPNRVLTVVSDDDDNRVLEAAIEGDADYITTSFPATRICSTLAPFKASRSSRLESSRRRRWAGAPTSYRCATGFKLYRSSLATLPIS
jgi:putative PIN family toxin of toxin-antitoxin system